MEFLLPGRCQTKYKHTSSKIINPTLDCPLPYLRYQVVIIKRELFRHLAIRDLVDYVTKPWPTISTTPLDAAKRQLDAAVRCLFRGDDPLAVHALGYASYGLLRDLAKTEGKEIVRGQLDADEKLFPENEFWRRFSDLGNALKHANRSAVDVPEEFNEALLLINCMLLRELERLASPETGALWLWHHALLFIDFEDAPDCYWNWIDQHWHQLYAQTRYEKVQIGALLYESMKGCDVTKYKLNPDQTLLPWRLVLQPSGPRNS